MKAINENVLTPEQLSAASNLMKMSIKALQGGEFTGTPCDPDLHRLALMVVKTFTIDTASARNRVFDVVLRYQSGQDRRKRQLQDSLID